MADKDRWKSEKLQQKLMNKIRRNINQASAWTVGQVKREINVGNANGKNPSLPGYPPKKVTARLFQSITHEVFQGGTYIIGTVGTNVVYARRLELGFVGTDAAGRNVMQAPRPFFTPVLMRNRERIIRKVLGQHGG